MIFNPLVKSWKEGSQSQRESASLELRNLSGSPLGWNRSSQETNLTVFGDGTLHYFRRGDFGERGVKPAGMWTGSCDRAEVDAIWLAFEGLAAKDFEGRAADPGEGVTQLQAQCGGHCVILAWGPAEMGVPRPGVDALAPLRRLVTKAQLEIKWTLRMTQGNLVRTSQGLKIPIEFTNEGKESIRFLIAPPEFGVELNFKYAVDESDESGPALQINWVDAEVKLPSESGLRLVELAPGGTTSIDALIPVVLPMDIGHLGQITYSQLTLGERVAGQPVFAGVTFTDIYNYKAVK